MSAVERARVAIERLREVEVAFGGVAALDPDRTLAEAAASDARRREGRAGPLEGVPVAVKDWIDVAGWPIAGSAVVHRERRPHRDATAVARLRAAGAVVVGITTALADSPAHGRTRNPHDPTRAPGGSSTGAAVVVAAGAVPIALGSDSGGSIRLPAAWCGTCGLRPTFGRVPLTGHFPRVGARSDARTAIGPMTASVDDLARVLAIINGPDGLDTGVAPVPLADPDSVAISSLRIGTVANGTPEHVLAALDRMRTAGASIADAALDDMRDEALDVTRRYWTRGRLSGAENERLLWDWDRFARRMATATHDVDVLVMPAVTEAAPPWRESIDTDYVWQLPWSLTGSPAVVVPFGDESGLPLSVQVVAPPWNDHIALAIASALTS